MEFNERKTDPPSTRELLYNQVKEQTDLCDITIKHGFWEKRFHWCVLVASPYFENIRRNSFIEKDLGMVSMTVATPVSLEQAILFLYGKKPKIHMQNIEALLEVAEYLIIPELKGHCVKWIKSKSANAGNCMTMLKLASLYGFDLLSYEDYLKGCIPDLIMTDEMMDLTSESVEHLFTDPTLSYVQTHDKFSFLVRWTNHRSDRIPMFRDLLKHIDFEDAKKEYVENVVIYEPLIQKLENATDFINILKKIDCHDYCDVLVFPNVLDNNKMQCFDLTRKRWCSVNVEIDNKPEHFQTYKIKESRCQKDVRSPYIYIIQLEQYSYDRKAFIFILNLENRTVEGSEIEVDESYRQKIKYNNELTYLFQDKVLIVSIERIQRPDLKQTGFDLHHIRLLLNAGIQVDPFLIHTAMGSRMMLESSSCSVLYIGSLQSGRTLVQPMLCIRDKITKLCANSTSLAMLSENAATLYVFNMVENSFDKLKLEFHPERQSFKLDRVGNDCFVVYNNKCFITIARQFGPNLCQKYHVDKYQFRIADDVDRHHLDEYSVCENKWYNYRRHAGGEKMLTVTTHDKLVASIRARDDGSDMDQSELWEPLTTDGYQSSYHSLGRNVLQIRLSKDRLSCAKHCPHCKVKEQNQRRVHHHDSDDDTSDDLYGDFYGYEDDYGYLERNYNVYGYDSDDYYYYDSD